MKHVTNSFERIPTEVYKNSLEAITSIAKVIVDLIRERQSNGKNVVLGLATGSTPVPLYKELIRYHSEEDLSFHNVITFNLDEYYGLSKEHPESYHRFMQDQLFDHVDIPDDQIHIPNGMSQKQTVFQDCKDYEDAIVEAGGIDIQILGIGRTGHIGFNEPGSTINSRTRRVTLDSLTIKDAARDFLGEMNVPKYAITMGIGTIMDARKVFLMAWGQSKAEVVKKAVEEELSDTIPASFLQQHDNVTFILDNAAASELTYLKFPWLAGFPEWTPELVCKAVSNLSLLTGKPILKLIDKDYLENGLSDLVTELGPSYQLNIRIFNEIQHTITGWPGGKPNVDDSHRPERAEPALKRVLVLSPEPLEDVSAMGGTLSRLVSQGHDVSVIYMTSGNLAVPDIEARWTLNLLGQLKVEPVNSFIEDANAFLIEKCEFDEDIQALRELKALIRRNEALASLEICGIGKGKVKFLHLPFYEKGRYRRFNITQEDLSLLAPEIKKIQPHQIFVTGYKSEPSSVEGKAFSVFEKAIESLLDESWMKDCWVWLYRGGDNEWNISEIDMAVPCSPDELSRKNHAVYQHRSQRSQTPNIEQNHLEAWGQAMVRNRKTAKLYDELGLAEYESIECFARWQPGQAK